MKTFYHSILLHIFIGVLLAFTSVILCAVLVTDNHNWGGDFSQYIAQAISIVQHTVPTQIANNTLMMSYSDGVYGPNVYPWGYPLLLAVVFAMYGFNLIAFKWVNIILFGIFIWAFYIFLTRYFSIKFSIITTLFFAINPMFIYFCVDNVLSDIAYMLFSFVAVVFLAKMCNVFLDRQKIDIPISQNTLSYQYIYILGGFFAFLAYYMRTNGIAIMMALMCVHCIYIIRYKKFTLLYFIPYGVFAILFILSKYIAFNGGDGYFSVLLESISYKSIVGNIIYYCGVFGDFFAMPTRFYFDTGLKYNFLLPHPIGFIFEIFFLYFMFIGIKARYKQDTFFLLFVVFSMLILIVWPALQGIRFVFCILPFLVFWTAWGIYLSKKRFLIIPIVVTLALFIGKDIYYLLMLKERSQQTLQAFTQESKDAYAAIQASTKANDIIVFFKPRVLYLATHRLSYGTNNISHIDRAQYLLEFMPSPLFTSEQLQQFEIVYKSENFILYRLR